MIPVLISSIIRAFLLPKASIILDKLFFLFEVAAFVKSDVGLEKTQKAKKAP